MLNYQSHPLWLSSAGSHLKFQNLHYTRDSYDAKSECLLQLCVEKCADGVFEVTLVTGGGRESYQVDQHHALQAIGQWMSELNGCTFVCWDEHVPSCVVDN